jgi:hypothetical protein
MQRQKNHQLELMAGIYNRATATLIASSGRDADCILVPAEAVAAALKFSREIHAANMGGELIPSPQEIRESILSSHHSQRRWTYQERLLSRRRIYFFTDQIVFHCRQGLCFPIELPPRPKFTLQLGKTYHPNKSRDFRCGGDVWQDYMD